MKRERLLARDEAALLGDSERFWKLLLKSIRSSRTQTRNLIAQIDLSVAKWPSLADGSLAETRARLEAELPRLDEYEALFMRELAACRDAGEESLG